MLWPRYLTRVRPACLRRALPRNGRPGEYSGGSQLGRQPAGSPSVCPPLLPTSSHPSRRPAPAAALTARAPLHQRPAGCSLPSTDAASRLSGSARLRRGLLPAAASPTCHATGPRCCQPQAARAPPARPPARTCRPPPGWAPPRARPPAPRARGPAPPASCQSSMSPSCMVLNSSSFRRSLPQRALRPCRRRALGQLAQAGGGCGCGCGSGKLTTRSTGQQTLLPWRNPGQRGRTSSPGGGLPGPARRPPWWRCAAGGRRAGAGSSKTP